MPRTAVTNADFYLLESSLEPEGRQLLLRIREFMEKSILLENHVGRFVADSEAIYSYEGTREINTLIVGRAITGVGAFV
jgi:alkylation response protein AidB-like acyl-CoA dehydrogenase